MNAGLLHVFKNYYKKETLDLYTELNHLPLPFAGTAAVRAFKIPSAA